MPEIESSKELKPSGLKVILFFLKPYKLRITSLLILSLIVGVLETTCVATVYPILSLGLDIKLGQDNILFSLINAIATVLPIEDTFISYCIFFILIAILAFIAKLALINLRVHVTSDAVSGNTKNVFKKYMGADYQYFIDHKQGELIYNASTAPRGISVLMTAVTTLLSEAILALSIFILLFSISWRGTIGTVLLVVGYYYVTKYLGTKISYFTGKGRVEAGTRENVVLNEVISGIRQVKVFMTQGSWIRKFNSAVEQLWGYWRKDTVWLQIPAFSLLFLLYFLMGIIAIIQKIRAPDNFMQSVPVFGTFGLALFRLLPIVSNFGMLRMNIMSSLPNCELVYSALNEKPSYIPDGKKELASFESNICFENVSFSHKGRSRILEGISITLEKGKITAIVGPSGAGKTTIVDLLLRLFDPDEGEVKIDGVNLKEYKAASWLSKIGFVSQDTFIFHESARNNITFGSEEYPDQEIIKAAREANADDFIIKLPQGYDTPVGDRGTKLSGGEKQRIAIARAMIRKPEVLILDEATSALDNVSEKVVQEAIDKVSHGCTTLIIAHRLSTIRNADMIYVLDRGKIAESGTHEQLMNQQGKYWELYKTQG